MAIFARVETASGAVIDAEWVEDGPVEISQNGHGVGVGRLRHGKKGEGWVRIEDCAARLGAPDGSEVEAAYSALEAAFVKSLTSAGVL